MRSLALLLALPLALTACTSRDAPVEPAAVPTTDATVLAPAEQPELPANGMAGMDHSTMAGMDHSGADSGAMPDMGHATMAEMDHGAMPGMGRGAMAGMERRGAASGVMASMDHSTMAGMERSDANSGAMPGMDHAEMAGMGRGTVAGMDRATMPGMGHGTMAGMDSPGADRGTMAGMDHSAMPGMDNAAMAGMDHGQMAGTDMSGMDHSSMPEMTEVGHEREQRPDVDPQAFDASATADRFHAALAAGDRAAMEALLAPDAVVLEGGGHEARAEYLSDHFEHDVAALAGMMPESLFRRTGKAGDVAWVASTQRVGTTDTAELLVMRRTPEGWRVAAVHWSSAR